MSPQQLRQVRPLASEPVNRRADSPYLNSEECARYLRFASARALYKAIEGGVTNVHGEPIPFCRRGRTFLFDVRDLDRWLHVATVTASAASRTSTSGARTFGEGR